MNDIRDDLSELLRRKADQVPPHREVPRSLVGRARRRIAVNVLGAGLMIVVLAGGAFAGLRALGAVPIQQPVGVPSTSSAPRTQTAPSISACTSAQFRAVGSMGGAAGSREGSICLTNFSDVTCTLQGTPPITLLEQNLKPIASGVTFSSAPPG
jgi:hypothetical protein